MEKALEFAGSIKFSGKKIFVLGSMLELCHRALLIRHKRLLGTPSDVAPILWHFNIITLPAVANIPFKNKIGSHFISPLSERRNSHCFDIKAAGTYSQLLW